MKINFTFLQFLYTISLLIPLNLEAQNTPPSGAKVIAFTTSENAEIKIDLQAESENTPIWIETSSGNYTSINLGTSWTGSKTYSVIGNELKIYGDVSSIDCSYNNEKLTSLDISSNTSLKTLYSHENKLSSLNLHGATALKVIGASNNQIESLDTSTNINLLELDCSDNKLTSIDVGSNTNLKSFSCFNNQITSLNISSNKSLTSLWVSDNKLVYLNLANGKNVNGDSTPGLNFVDAKNNPDLSCIQIDSGFTPGYGWHKDSTANWSSEPCPTTSTSDLEKDNFSIKVYPNPTSKQINVSLDKDFSAEFALSILNMNGKQVFSKPFVNNNKVTINVEHYPKGIYFIFIKTAENKYIKKFMVN